MTANHQRNLLDIIEKLKRRLDDLEGSRALGAPVLVGRAVVGATAQPLLSVPIPTNAGINHLHCTFTGRQDAGTSGGGLCYIQLSGDTGGHYLHQDVLGQQSTVSAAVSGALVNGVRVGVLPLAGDTASYVGMGAFEVGAIASSLFKPVVSAFHSMMSPTNGAAGIHGGLWLSTAPVTRVDLFPNSGNFVSGSSLTVLGWP